MIGFGQAVLHEVHDFLGYLLRGFLLHEEEVGVLAIAGIGKTPLVDGVGTHHDAAGLCLPENACQAGDGYFFTVYNITEHVAGSHAGQLFGVAHHDEAHGSGDCLHQVVH